MKHVRRTSLLRLAQAVAAGGLLAAAVVQGCGSNGGSSGDGGSSSGGDSSVANEVGPPADSTAPSSDGMTIDDLNPATDTPISSDGSCPPGDTACGSLSGYCANLQNDSRNCGVCANECPSGDICQAGHCVPGSSSSGGDDGSTDSSSGSGSGGDTGTGDSSSGSSSSGGNDSGGDDSAGDDSSSGSSGGGDGAADANLDGGTDATSSGSGSGGSSGSGSGSSGGNVEAGCYDAGFSCGVNPTPFCCLSCCSHGCEKPVDGGAVFCQ